LAQEQGLVSAADRVASLAPAQRSRRLYEELRYQAVRTDFPAMVDAGFSSGVADPHDPLIQAELVRELRGLHVMHGESDPRIFEQEAFQRGGTYYELVTKAGIDVGAPESRGQQA
jgi:hypothetical protein